MINEIKALKEHECVVFVPKVNKGKFNWDFPCTTYEFPSIIFPAYPGYNISIPSGLLKRALKKEKRLDLIHIQTPFTAGYLGLLAAQIHKTPTVMTYHTWLSEYVGHLLVGFAEQTMKKWLNAPTWSYTRLLYNRVDAVIAPSKMLTKELYEHNVNKDHLFAVPNSISPIFFEKNVIQKNKFRKMFKIPLDKTVIIYIGRISYEKRLESLLQSYNELKQKDDNLHLVIVGDGPHLSMYKQSAEKLKLKDCIFTGFYPHDNLPEAYQAGDIFVSPSDTETQGLTYIEAMSQGVPVIGVKAGGVVDYVIHGENGLLAKTRNSEHIKEEIERLLYDKDLQAKLQKNGLKTAHNYSLEGFGKNLQNVFDYAIKRYYEKHKVR